MSNLNNLQIEVLNNIKADIHSGENMAIKIAAQRYFVSPAFLVKLAKKIGYSGYKELIISFKNSSSTIMTNSDIDINIIEDFTKEKFNKFVNIIDNVNKNGSYVDTIGFGYSEIASSYISYELSESGFKSSYFKDITSMLDENAVLFAISCSGENDVIINLVETAKISKHKIIAFTRNPKSRLARKSDIYFTIGRSFEEKHLGFEGFAACTILAFQSLLSLYSKK